MGVILTGTLGIEMALEGIPVVSAGINPCYGLGLLSEPEDIESYFDLIMSTKNATQDKAQLELFSYFYFIHQCFKWPLTSASFGEVFSGYAFDEVHELEQGKIEHLDAIFEEIEFLVADYQSTLVDTINAR